MNSNLGLNTVRRRLFATTAAQRSLLRFERKFTSTAGRCWTASVQPHVHHHHHHRHHHARSWQRRDFHRSAVLLEEENSSENERKKDLNEKSEATAAAAEEDAAADKKKALQEKLAAKKAAEQEAVTTEEAPAVEEAPAASAPKEEETKPAPEHLSPELAEDAAKHKAGLDDPDRPFFQNPLHHNNPEMEKVFLEDFESKEAMEAATVPAPPLDLGDGIAAPEYLHALADEIVHLNMLEMNELVNKIADHYGFHESMLSPDEDGAGEGEDDDAEEGEGAAQEEAKTSFDIKLVEFDASAKIKVIKEVRALAGLGLKEAKEMVEGAPKVIHKGVKKEEAEEIKAKLEALGATIEIV